MEIILGKTAGFCYGVTRAINGAEEELETNENNVYCLGEIVHNKNVIDDLTKKGLKFIEDIKESKGKTIIRAHGVTKDVYQKANEMNIELKDLTCPKVLKIHEIADKYTHLGYYVVLIGSEKHPEVIGIKSFCEDDRSCIVNDENDIEKTILNIKKTEIKKVLIIAQTTYNSKKFDNIVNEIKEKIEDDYEVNIMKTICPATEMRQRETEEIAKEVDYMIIIGDKKSSNTNKLYEISSKYCKDTIFINNSNELDTRSIKDKNKVGIMAGASTPKENIELVFEKLIFNK